MPRDLGQRAQDFREKWLAPSGGWLGELVIFISDLAGVWDVIIIAGVFVCAWIVVRTSPMEISMVLALVFDLTIPLQYYNNEYLRKKHAEHLENYWPSLMMGCLIEGVCFFLLHPDLFTLIVCLKTSAMTILWMIRDQDGLPIKVQSPFDPSGRRSSGGGSVQDSDGRSSSRRSGGSDPPPRTSRDSSRTSSTRPETSNSSSSQPPKPSSSSQAPETSERSESKPPSSGSSTPSNMPTSKNVSNPYKYLHRAGYPDPAIAGMILALNAAEKDRARKQMNAWVQEKDRKEIERRDKRYSESAKKAGWPKKFEQGGEGSGGGKTTLAIPQEAIEKAEASMKSKKVPSEERKKVMDLLKHPKSEKELQAAGKILKEMGIPVKLPKGGEGGESSSSGHKMGESDGHGGYRDIKLSKDTVQTLNQAMAQKQWSKEDHVKWLAYIQRPLSRREFERKVIPLAKSLNVYIGGGYTGGGPHRFDVKKLAEIKGKIKSRCGVDSGMAEHMIVHAINQRTSKEAQDMLNRWATKGIKRDDFEKLRKTAPDWA
ncbi:hypothetical protein L202_05057 [Cryptococcus amylolentus CBS 6039]|uniref:Uncharacterized protein n=1 Tax=Cryptococcus amylolentus CBS 6039 TaxID=1295533 RepID=A0A1E3HNQ7_9TREE|nr:hypothetical protein L202_05057 [Cryptococcus amylolentus CBS 6039]ODN77964.1 hypothetical protein L202_05057 [Cryptococcus amylolentus CBS 6039]